MNLLQNLTRLMLVVLISHLASSFILDNNECVAPAPCTCSGSVIVCDQKGLQTVPQFKHSNISSNSPVSFYLYGNNITTLGPNAFCNITFSESTTVRMLLYSNHMASMSSSAFNCIGEHIVYLKMDSNRFSVLPQTLKSLVNLTYLNVDTNPLTALDSSVMSVIGRTLRTLDVDLSNFTSWPSEFRFLRVIDTLYLKQIQLPRLSTDAFHGMETTLRTLTITHSRLEGMPLAVCHLQQLQSLTFTYNYYLNLNTTVFEPCSRRMNSVTSLALHGNNFRNFPDVFHTFPELTSLDLHYNKLRYINGDLIPAHNRLTTINLGTNNFTRIPNAVNKFHSLTNLYIEHNHIGAIYDTDLHNLKALTQLVLYNNGLEFISSHAFRNNPKLSYLNLDYNPLRTISSSITTLQSFGTLFLRNTNIECNCDLSHLKSWNVTNMSLCGNCESSSETLKQFLLNALPGCP